MRKVTAVVIGAGALGNEVARILGLLGTSGVTVVDPDVVESSNLPRSIFFSGGKSIGQNKAHGLVVPARDLFPDTHWSAIGSEIADVGFRRLANASLLFSCVDSDLARLEIAYISSRLLIPVADAGLGTRNYSHGRMTYFPGTPEQACYSCMLTPTKRRELLELWEATLRPCTQGSGDADEEIGSTPTMAGIVGGIQVELGLRNHFEEKPGIPKQARSFEIQIHPARRIDEFVIPVSAECPFHHCEEQLYPMPRPDATFEELLDATAGEAVILDWPICVEARCSDCGRAWSPMLRLAALRRKGRCPACGSRQVLEMQTIRTVVRESPWLQQAASALQLPADHLYSVQRRRS
jgi:molybdopterin/thiamine biosynthesis adenylyltransferase/DNA-directed RNA polymerase subunit RPC12/RpoP